MSRSKPKQSEYVASISVSIWVDVPLKADSLEAALAHAREIKLDRILERGHTDGVIDCSKPKVTGIYALDNQPEEL